MNIFEDLKEIEQLYTDLKDKVMEKNSQELEEFKQKSIEKYEESAKGQRALIESFLDSFSKELSKYQDEFYQKYESVLSSLKEKYQKKEQEIIDIILDKMRLNF